MVTAANLSILIHAINIAGGQLRGSSRQRVEWTSLSSTTVAVEYWLGLYHLITRRITIKHCFTLSIFSSFVVACVLPHLISCAFPPGTQIITWRCLLIQPFWKRKLNSHKTITLIRLLPFEVWVLRYWRALAKDKANAVCLLITVFQMNLLTAVQQPPLIPESRTPRTTSDTSNITTDLLLLYITLKTKRLYPVVLCRYLHMHNSSMLLHRAIMTKAGRKSTESSINQSTSI